MSKNVLVISSSPRKGGNSDLLCDQFIKGAQEAGHHTEKISLREQKINYCTGCGVCNDTHRCVQKDDMGEIHEAIAAADVVVLASPLYFYSWSAQIKPVWDRLLPFYGENSKIDLRGKKAVLVTAAGDDDTACFGGLRESFRLGCGYTKWEIAGEIYAPGMYPKDAVATGGRKYIEEAYELGKRL